MFELLRCILEQADTYLNLLVVDKAARSVATCVNNANPRYTMSTLKAKTLPLFYLVSPPSSTCSKKIFLTKYKNLPSGNQWFIESNPPTLYIIIITW